MLSARSSSWAFDSQSELAKRLSHWDWIFGAPFRVQSLLFFLYLVSSGILRCSYHGFGLLASPYLSLCDIIGIWLMSPAISHLSGFMVLRSSNIPAPDDISPVFISSDLKRTSSLVFQVSSSSTLWELDHHRFQTDHLSMRGKRVRFSSK